MRRESYVKVHMRFTFIPVICLLGIPLGVTAETACNLSMKELPKVEGMYLGMDEKEFKTLIPTAKRNYPNTNKVVEGVSDYEGYLKVGPFLYYYQSAFLNGKLVWLGLSYGDKSGVKNTDQAIRKFATHYGIPTEGWTPPSKDVGPSKELLCRDFSIWILGPLHGRGGIDPATVIIKDTEGSAIHQARRDKEAWWNKSRKRFEISQFYQSAGQFYHIVVKTDEQLQLKCVAYDEAGTPLAVDRFSVTPPAEEVVMSIPVGQSTNKRLECTVAN